MSHGQNRLGMATADIAAHNRLMESYRSAANASESQYYGETRYL